jgi:hypothetical protein
MGVVYEVRVAGSQTDSWSAWFPGVRAEHRNDTERSACTVLFVPGQDVSLLHGVLAQIGGLNLCLLSVNRIEGRDL